MVTNNYKTFIEVDEDYRITKDTATFIAQKFVELFLAEITTINSETGAGKMTVSRYHKN